VEGDQIIIFFQGVRILPKVRLDAGTQQGCLDAAWILSERLVAVLYGKVVIAFLSINFRAKVERRPQFGIDSERRINIALCTGDISILQLMACIAAQVHGCSLVSRRVNDDGYASIDSRKACDNYNEKCDCFQGFHLCPCRIRCVVEIQADDKQRSPASIAKRAV
jgi:hypothetical protein